MIMIMKRITSTIMIKIKTKEATPRMKSYSPGRPGWFPTQAPHRSVLAQLTHTAPHFKLSLRDGTPSGRPPLAGADNAPAIGTSAPRGLRRRDDVGQAISSKAR